VLFSPFFFKLFYFKMVSTQVIPVIGLDVTVYGLEEYKRLPQGSPVSVLFALHGRLRKSYIYLNKGKHCYITQFGFIENQSKMEPIAQAICSLNEKRQHHILVVTFDCPNHGHRLVHKLANFAWVEGKYSNPNHAIDMWAMVHSTSRTISELIDVLEHYMFGPQPQPLVQVWGSLGFSMGGHATFIAAANGKTGETNYKKKKK
jgi:hypothetical protein